MNFIEKMGKKRQIFLTAISFIILLAASVLLYSLLTGSKPIRLGFLGTISGKYGALGSTARDGALLAVEEINETGGVMGRKLEMVILDDGGDPEKAAAHARSLAEEGIRFIIGPFLTASGTSILPIVNKNGILTISGTTMGQNLADKDDFYLVLIPTTRYYGEEIARVALNGGHLRFASISDSRNDPYCTTFVEGIRSILNAAPETSLKAITFQSSNDVPYSRIIDGIDLEKIDAVFLCSSAMDTAFLAQKIKDRREEAALLSTSWAISWELVQNGGSAVEGILFLQAIDSSDSSPRYKKFLENYKNRFGQEPTYVAIFNYEAVMMLMGGLKEESSCDPERIKRSILKKEEQWGVQQNFRLDREGDTLRPLMLHTISNGLFVPAGSS